MKKKTYLVVLALCAALAMTACGTSSDNKGDTKTAETQDTTEKSDSASSDSTESDKTDKDKDSEESASGDTRLVSVDDVTKYVTIGQ